MPKSHSNNIREIEDIVSLHSALQSFYQWTDKYFNIARRTEVGDDMYFDQPEILSQMSTDNKKLFPF